MHHYAAIMFLAGIGIPILAALNAALGRFILSPSVAAAILFTIAGLVTWALAFATCLLYTSPSPRDLSTSRMPSSA